MAEGALAGDLQFGVFHFFAQGQKGEEFVATRHAAKSGNTQKAPERSANAFGKFAGDALELNIAADGAMGGEQMG